MNDVTVLFLASIAGILLGIIYFGGLWYTVRKGIGTKQTVAWFLSSFLIRASVAVTGFYFVGAGHWQRILVCLVGFMVGRIIVTQFTKQYTKRSSSENHA